VKSSYHPHTSCIIRGGRRREGKRRGRKGEGERGPAVALKPQGPEGP